MKSQTVVALLVLAVALLIAGAIAMRGDDKPKTAQAAEPVNIEISGTVPYRGRAAESSLVPQPQRAPGGDPIPAPPKNWR